MAQLHFPLVTGADESKSAKLLTLPRLRRAENFRVAERSTLRKRFGTAAYAAGAPDSGQSTPIGPIRLARHGNQTLVFAEDSLWTVGADGARLEELDGLPRTTLEGVTRLGHYGSADVMSAGSAQTTAFRVWGWVTYDGTDYKLHLMTVDLASGAGSAATVVPLNAADEETINFKLITIGSKVTAFWGEAGGNIKYLDITSATSGPYTTTQGTELVTAGDGSADTAQWFDVAPHSTGYVLGFRSGTNTCTVRRFNGSHALQATANHTIAGTTWHTAVVGDVAQMALVTGSDDATVALSIKFLDADCTARSTYTLSPTVALGAGSEIIGVTACKYGSTATSVAFAYNALTSVGLHAFRCGTTSEGGGDISLVGAQAQTRFASKPWVFRGDVYCLVRFFASQANSYCAVVRHAAGADSVVAMNYPMLEARIREGRGPSNTSYSVEPAVGVAFDGESAHVAVIALDRFSSPSVLTDPTGGTAVDPDQSSATGTQTIDVLGVDGFSFSHASRARWQTVQAGEYTAISGGVPTVFDSRRVTEIGWASYPEIGGATPSATGGALDDGLYAWGNLWGYVDYLGNRSQSAPNIVQNVTVDSVANDEALVTLVGPYRIPHTLRHWMLPGDDDRRIVWEIYTTAANGTTLHRLEGSGVSAFEENAMGGSSASRLDSYVDSFNRDTIAITSRELLYTSQFGSSELPNMMPPPTNVITTHEGRILGVDAEDPTSVWYTKIQFPGTAPAWNQVLRIQFEVIVTALASQDGNLIAFSRSRIYTVTGVGLDNLGATGGYNAPQLLSGHVGCTRPRSVLATPVGLFFQSDQGIEVLPRGGGSPQYIGEPVRDTLRSWPIITSALHVQARSEVWFACVDSEDLGDSPTGRVLVFDYRVGAWFVRNYQGRPVSSMVLEPGDTAVEGAGRVVLGIYDADDGITLWREDAGFDDPDGFVGTVLETGDIRLIGGQATTVGEAAGFQNIRSLMILGEVAASSKLLVEESYDSRGTWTSKPATTLSATDNFVTKYQTLRRRANTHAYRFTEQQATSADSEGIAYTLLSFDCDPKRGASRQRPTERI